EDAAAEKNARDQSEPAENFQPGEIERQPDGNAPRQRLVVVDIARELDRIDDLDRPRVNEERANQDRDDLRDPSHFFPSHASQPPFRIRMSLGSFASARNRRATSSARLQLAALQ